MGQKENEQPLGLTGYREHPKLESQANSFILRHPNDFTDKKDDSKPFKEFNPQ